MTEREAVAQAMAFFEATDDIVLLHHALGEVAPRAKKMVAQLLGRGTEEAIPPPADLRPARQPASKEQAMRTLKTTADFALLQVLARSVGRRIEAAEIAASAEFPEGAHVIVPANPTFPPSGPSLPGNVEVTGTMLRVLLDNGETWNGPPSLARLA
ncbi:MAG: hypothetical protein ABI782_03490 [Anaerolineaceae bacterium]